jgi:hypothetical protein
MRLSRNLKMQYRRELNSMIDFTRFKGIGVPPLNFNDLTVVRGRMAGVARNATPAPSLPFGAIIK